MLYAVLPPIIIGLSSCFWLVVAFIKGRMDYVYNQNVASIIILLFLFHPDIVKVSSMMFQCTEVDNKSFMAIDVT